MWLVDPNIGFQIQLQLYENTHSLVHPEFNILAELVLSIQKKISEVDAVLSRVFEDPEVPSCLSSEYLAHYLHQLVGACISGALENIWVLL